MDNAWRFMKEFGVPVESCHPYTKCEYPAFPNCTAPKGTMFECSGTHGCIPSASGESSSSPFQHPLTDIPRQLELGMRPRLV
eukprot:COSAG05_NODE_255_length_12816_cov_13.781631_11_plen_82_part_00